MALVRPRASGGVWEQEELPQLLLNQYVSSSLAWRAAGIGLTVNATLYAPGPSLQAQLQLSALPPSQQAPGAALPPGGRLFSLALRIPAWSQPQHLGSSGHRLPAVVTVNGQAWEWGPAGAAEKQGSYLHLTR
ncbi:AbfB domain-containing protein [Haematococcus lacustris]|uniref:AbfB domain-containing protein n=1 Tax=Haematococcus lacustris TaxID=44745 RepID=A0A699YA02_HAELA|nr:AbfB domain-containing protein [Haematococcus lacustris]